MTLDMNEAADRETLNQLFARANNQLFAVRLRVHTDTQVRNIDTNPRKVPHPRKKQARLDQNRRIRTS